MSVAPEVFRMSWFGASEERMPIVEGFDFFPLRFDENGTLQSRQEFDALTARASSATDVVFIAHGFRNDENDATRSLHAFPRHAQGEPRRVRNSARWPIGSSSFAGVYWPSKPFRESYDDGESGTRGLQTPFARRWPTRKAQLEEFKANDASPAQRQDLDRAIALAANTREQSAGTR